MKVDLYGSLSLTGKGLASDLAILLGLAREDPENIPTEEIIPKTNAKVPLDKGITTMWEMAKDMKSKYKETSEDDFSRKC